MPKKGGKKLVFTQGDARVEDFFMLLTEEEQMMQIVLDLVTTEKDRDKLLQSFVYIISSKDQRRMASLIKSSITKEINQHADFLIDSSICGKLFNFHCTLVCGDYLKSVITGSGILDELQDSKDEVKPHSDQLMEMTQKVLSAIFKDLITAPFPILEVCRFFFDELKRTHAGQNNNALLERVSTLLFGQFFCPAIELPENYNVVNEPPKKKVKKGLQMISEVVRSITCIKGEIQSAGTAGADDPRMAQFVKKRSDIARQLIEDWLNQGVTDEVKLVSISLSWTTLEEALRGSHQFLCDRLSTVNSKLGSAGSTRLVTFKLSDFMDALVSSAMPSRSENVKSNAF